MTSVHRALRWLRVHWRSFAATGGLLFVFWVGLTLGDIQERDDRQDAIDRARTVQLQQIVAQQEKDRAAAAIASCERGNEIRAGIRELARDLNADRRTIDVVYQRFQDIDCSATPGATVNPPPEEP